MSLCIPFEVAAVPLPTLFVFHSCSLTFNPSWLMTCQWLLLNLHGTEPFMSLSACGCQRFQHSWFIRVVASFSEHSSLVSQWLHMRRDAGSSSLFVRDRPFSCCLSHSFIACDKSELICRLISVSQHNLLDSKSYRGFYSDLHMNTYSIFCHLAFASLLIELVFPYHSRLIPPPLPRCMFTVIFAYWLGIFISRLFSSQWHSRCPFSEEMSQCSCITHLTDKNTADDPSVKQTQNWFWRIL